jgi:3-dehydrosphinganine reductase
MGLPQGAALITGGSSGIGLATAELLVRRGFPVTLVARGKEGLARAAERLRSSHPGARVHAEAVDVADAAGLAAAVERAVAANGELSLVVCSAGITVPGTYRDVSTSDHRRVMEINYFGTLHTVAACRPHLCPGARLALVSSAAALFGLYGYAAYAPSKFAVRGLAEVLRVELAAEGIGVTLVMPPDTDTPQLAAELPLRPAVTSRVAALGSGLPAEVVAQALVDGLAANRFLVLPESSLGLLHLLSGVLGPALRALQAWFLRAEQRRLGR